MLKYTITKRINASHVKVYAVLCQNSPIMADTTDEIDAFAVLKKSARNGDKVEYWDGIASEFVTPDKF